MLLRVLEVAVHMVGGLDMFDSFDSCLMGLSTKSHQHTQLQACEAAANTTAQT